LLILGRFRETIDAILRVVTPSCRAEVESALESQSDISDECKLEIQAVLQSFSQTDPQNPENVNREPPKKSVPKEHLIDPKIGVAIFVGLLITGVGGYVVYVNQLLQKYYPQKKEKKLSKKKVTSMLTYSYI